MTILFTVKRHLIIFKYDEVIDILADHLAIFFAWCVSGSELLGKPMSEVLE